MYISCISPAFCFDTDTGNTGQAFLDEDYNKFKSLYLKTNNKDYFSNNNGSTIGYIDFSILKKDSRFFSLTIQHGNPNFPDNLDITPISTAATICDLDKAKALVTKGANINHTSKVLGVTPLHAAITEDCYDVAEYLVNQGAINFPGNERVPSPLDTAIMSKDNRMIEIIMKAKPYHQEP